LSAKAKDIKHMRTGPARREILRGELNLNYGVSQYSVTRDR